MNNYLISFELYRKLYNFDFSIIMSKNISHKSIFKDENLKYMKFIQIESSFIII